MSGQTEMKMGSMVEAQARRTALARERFRFRAVMVVGITQVLLLALVALGMWR